MYMGCLKIKLEQHYFTLRMYMYITHVHVHVHDHARLNSHWRNMHKVQPPAYEE